MFPDDFMTNLISAKRNLPESDNICQSPKTNARLHKSLQESENIQTRAMIINESNNKTSKIEDGFRIILGLFMTFAGIGHLTFQRKEFLAQVPGWLPDSAAFMDFVVIASGIVEIGLGIAMIFLARHKIKVGLLLALFFILIFPGNISQYTNGIDAFGLDTDRKRLIRLFFQPVLILWALWSTGALSWLINRGGWRSETHLSGRS